MHMGWQVGLVVNTLCCSADDPGLIPCGGAVKGNFNFLDAFQCFRWQKPRAVAALVKHCEN